MTDFLAISDMPLADAAEAYARSGIKVFPLAPGTKIPTGGHGHLDATDDVDQVRTWWAANPEANIGIPASANGWYVIDTDPRNGGVRVPPDVPTLAASTPNGGTHDVLSAADLNGHRLIGKLAAGIDVKSEGYIVVAPSRVPGTHDDRYRWTAPGPPATDPAMNARVIKGAAVEPTANDWLMRPDAAGLFEEIPPGDQEETLRDHAWRLTGTTLARADGIAVLERVIEGFENEPGRSPWDPGQAAAAYWDRAVSKRTEEAADHECRLKITRASEIQPRVTHWLLEGKIPVGALALLAGREGIGKSTVALTFAAQLTRGTMPGAFHGTARSVVIVATEDSWSHTIVPRLMASGADLDRVLRVDAYTPEGFEDTISLPADLPELGKICKTENVALIILDPLMSAVSGRIDTHKDHELRRALDPLVRLAGTTRAAVLGLIHFNKTATADPLTAVMGSKAFAAVARAVLAVIADPDDRDRFLLGNPKNNLGRSNLPSLVYRITGAHVADTDEGAVWTSKIEWLGEDDQSVRDVMEATAERATGSQGAECAGWLREFLLAREDADPPHSAPRAEIVAAGRAEGYSLPTIKRAQAKAGVEIQNTRTVPRSTVWILTPFRRK